MGTSDKIASVEKVESRNVFGADRRATKRVPLVLKIEVSGQDRKLGRIFRETTTTIDISETGCRFQLNRELHRGDEVAILCEDNTGGEGQSKCQPALFHVVWAEPAEDHGSLIGAMQLRAGNVWPAALTA
jgi:hypothetical protein